MASKKTGNHFTQLELFHVLLAITQYFLCSAPLIQHLLYFTIPSHCIGQAKIR